MKFEQPQHNNAERRREQSEEKGQLNISHWRGDLHAHTGDTVENPQTPEEVIETRRGSNCGSIPLEVLARYHDREMVNEYLAITEHSRDASPAIAREGVTNWFLAMRLQDEAWLEENIGKTKAETPEEVDEVKELIKDEVEQVANYGDERLQATLNDIEQLSADGMPIKIFKGVEANLLPDGSFDTEMVDKGKFEIVNCSIHPNLDPEGFAEIVEDPEQYTDLVIKGIENPHTNIMAHIGHDLKLEMVAQLDWDRIAQTAQENKVAIEINLKSLMGFIYDEIMDYEKYPKSDTSWRDHLKEKLPDLIPILSSEAIAGRLKKYFAQRLMISINTDEHKNKFIDHRSTREGALTKFKERDKRFWIAMKIVEKYFNQLFEQTDIRQENILNTYSAKQVEAYFKKSS